MQKDVELPRHREGESGTVPFRSGRIFNVGPLWYFATREGTENGPFISRELAEASLHAYVNDCVPEK